MGVHEHLRAAALKMAPPLFCSGARIPRCKPGALTFNPSAWTSVRRLQTRAGRVLLFGYANMTLHDGSAFRCGGSNPGSAVVVLSGTRARRCAGKLFRTPQGPLER